VFDEMDEPLGFVAGSAPALVARDEGPMRGVVTVAAILAIGVGLVMLPRPDFPVNGQPFAVAKVEILPAPPKLASPDTTASVVQIPAASAAQVETTNGVKIWRGSGGPQPLIINVAQALGAKLQPPALDSRLLDKSKYGPLPRTTIDGTRNAQPDH
jgi:uncharacterized protein